MSSQNPVFRIVVALRAFYLEFYGEFDLKAATAEAHKAHSVYHIERLYVDQNIDEKGYAQMRRRHLQLMRLETANIANITRRINKFKEIVILEALLGPDPDVITATLKVIEKSKAYIHLRGESPANIYDFTIVAIHKEGKQNGDIDQLYSAGYTITNKIGPMVSQFNMLGWGIDWREAHNRISEFISIYNSK